MSSSTRVLPALCFAAFGVFTLACTGATTTVAGDRAASGACPEGEVCSEEAPGGLFFQGQMLYDEGEARLGPVLVGGRFDLSFFPNGYTMDGKWAVEVEGADARVWDGQGPGVVLRGTEEGTATIRVVDPETGLLYDRLSIEVVELTDVEVTNVAEPDRSVLKAGCEEMIGIRMLSAEGRLRAFDQDLAVLAPEVVPDRFAWDCFRYVVPMDATEVTFALEAAGEIWERTVPVEPLEEGASCPVLSD